MTAPLFYHPGSKWQTTLAFAFAILVHAGAVAVAELKSDAPSLPPTDGDEVAVVIEPAEANLPPPPPSAEELDVVPPPPAVIDDEFVDDDKPTPPPRRVAKTAPPLVRPPGNAMPRGPSGSPKAFALSAPLPEYPYEARRQRLTGSGIAALTIDRASGAVTNVTMARSTGNATLDSATISGLRRWRFKPGTVSQVQTPITYTLTGASY